MTYKGLSGFLAGSRGGVFWVSQAMRGALAKMKTDEMFYGDVFSERIISTLLL